MLNRFSSSLWTLAKDLKSTASALPRLVPCSRGLFLLLPSTEGRPLWSFGTLKCRCSDIWGALMNDSDKFVDNKILSIHRLVSLELALSFFFFFESITHFTPQSVNHAYQRDHDRRLQWISLIGACKRIVDWCSLARRWQANIYMPYMRWGLWTKIAERHAF